MPSAILLEIEIDAALEKYYGVKKDSVDSFAEEVDDSFSEQAEEDITCAGSSDLLFVAGRL